ncbi:8024_t:CDS:2 [Funneliformis geosporum]|uniref:8024_t:CDS:1 n=1 Tax=Funneliformis geosporum TaxID=1117311 RepID=A0A9W4SKA4_9GLOM|nr:8024_t:CDS:2 [Funneliformis geosporum]
MEEIKKLRQETLQKERDTKNNGNPIYYDCHRCNKKVMDESVGMCKCKGETKHLLCEDCTKQRNMEKKIKNLKIGELKQRLSDLISYHTKRKEDAIKYNSEFYNKLNSIKEVEMMEKLPPKFLQAYLFLKQAYYSNYQEELLKHSNFDKESFLDRLEKEIEISEKSVGFITDDKIDLPKDYPLCVFIRDEHEETVLKAKENLLALVQEQAEKM